MNVRGPSGRSQEDTEREHAEDMLGAGQVENSSIGTLVRKKKIGKRDMDKEEKV